MDVLAELGTRVGEFLAAYGLLAIVVVMLLKEFGVPVPVPSDLIMITAGVQAAAGSYSLLELFIALEAAMLVGGSGQFLVARGAGRQFVYRVGRYVGLTPQRLDRAAALLQRRGALAVFLGLNVPGARAGIIPAAGLAGMAYPVFTGAMLSGSTVFYGWHVALGFVAGPSANALLEQLHLPLGPLMAGLAALGLAGWLLLRWRRGRQLGAGASGAVPAATLQAWSEAACPACLALAALQRLEGPALAPAEASG
jgi:membrane protein DedA with SNARE-associated domain